MNKRFCRQLLTALMAALCLSIFAGTAMAANPQSLQIPVQVQQTGELIETGDSYVIELRADQPDFPMPDGSADGIYDMQIIGAGDGVIDITYTELGVYTYTLYQVAGEKENCEYDPTIYHLRVYVTVNDSGEQEITAILTEGQKETKLEKALFVNAYSAGDPAVVTPIVKKTISTVSGTAPTDTSFSFTLTPENLNAPMPAAVAVNASTGTLTVKRTGAGNVDFGKIFFGVDSVGKTYVYTVSEVKGNVAGFTYDTKTYQMIVSVSAKDGQIFADVTYQDADGNAVDGITFSNIYEEVTAPTTMPKTGQPWLSVMVLAGLGVLLMAGGLMLKRKLS